jgi:hypothetical protein
VSSGLDATGYAALAAIVGVAVLVVLVAAQLFVSAGRAKEHLARATAIPAARASAAAERRGASRFEGAPHILAVVPPADATGSPLTERSRLFTLPSDDAPASPDDGAAELFGQLTQYYAANISQGYAIFWASLLAMIAGFAIIVVGIATAGANTTNAVVAGIAGLLSQFVAATFLVALRSTQEQSTAYAQNLADLRARDLRASADARAIALGLQLIEKIDANGATDLANETRAALAMGLVIKRLPDAEARRPATAGSVDSGDAPRDRPSAEPRARVQSIAFDETQSGAGTAERS